MIIWSRHSHAAWRGTVQKVIQETKNLNTHSVTMDRSVVIRCADGSLFEGSIWETYRLATFVAARRHWSEGRVRNRSNANRGYGIERWRLVLGKQCSWCSERMVALCQPCCAHRNRWTARQAKKSRVSERDLVRDATIYAMKHQQMIHPSWLQTVQSNSINFIEASRVAVSGYTRLTPTKGILTTTGKTGGKI